MTWFTLSRLYSANHKVTEKQMTFYTYNENNNDIFTFCSYRQNISSTGCPECKGQVWDALCALIRGTVLVSLCCQSLWFAPVYQWCKCPSVCLSVEQVQSRDGGFFRFLDLRFGQLDPTHSDHSTYGKVGGNAAHTEPEGPVQAVFQDDQHEEVFPMIGHPLGQTVVPHGCQEAQHAQRTKKSWKKSQIVRWSNAQKGYTEKTLQ